MKNRSKFRWIFGFVLLAVLSCFVYYEYVMLVRVNFHAVIPGRVYRSAQPSLNDLKEWSEKYGLRTVINLRGEGPEAYYIEEVAAAKELGLEHIDISLSARKLPSTYWLRRLVAAIENSPEPILLHCMAGADRTGVGSLIAAMALGGQSFKDAKSQMSKRYLHFNNDSESIAGLLHQYEAYCKNKNMDTQGWMKFKQWVTRIYHPKYYRVEFATPASITANPGKEIEVEITVTNRSNSTIPAGDVDKNFTLAAFFGTSVEEEPDFEFHPRKALPKKDIVPGESVSITRKITAPKSAGKYTLHFDLIEENVTWFATQGSLMGTSELHVKSP